MLSFRTSIGTSEFASSPLSSQHRRRAESLICPTSLPRPFFRQSSNDAAPTPPIAASNACRVSYSSLSRTDSISPESIDCRRSSVSLAAGSCRLASSSIGPVSIATSGDADGCSDTKLGSLQ
ncbi:hypothetical protein PIB30_091446 [Stylosanthes scabra]|uniref:Uncharacterized protein n=1 Tax=Stylosanthes scabra TaxID=79078 RepID=A0ABU6YU53_9FABA|nr:hypothetical protein [Stylosanthes scabra]